MSNKSCKLYKIGALILLIAILLTGAFWFWKNNTEPKEPAQEEIALGNSQKASDKYSQLLVRITNPGEANDGDIITIGGETHEWGRMEKIKFLIVTIPVLTAEEKAEFVKEADGRKAYRVAYEKFLTSEEIAKIKAQKEGMGRYILISKENIVKK